MKDIVKIEGTVTVGAKGQVVIPNSIRKRMNINPGDNLIAISKGEGGIILIKAHNLEKFINYAQKIMQDIIE